MSLTLTLGMGSSRREPTLFLFEGVNPRLCRRLPQGQRSEPKKSVSRRLGCPRPRRRYAPTGVPRLHRSASGATWTFSRRPLSRGFRPFAWPILNDNEGATPDPSRVGEVLTPGRSATG